MARYSAERLSAAVLLTGSAMLIPVSLPQLADQDWGAPNAQRLARARLQPRVLAARHERALVRRHPSRGRGARDGLPLPRAVLRRPDRDGGARRARLAGRVGRRRRHPGGVLVARRGDTRADAARGAARGGASRRRRDPRRRRRGRRRPAPARRRPGAPARRSTSPPRRPSARGSGRRAGRRAARACRRGRARPVRAAPARGGAGWGRLAHRLAHATGVQSSIRTPLGSRT